MNGYQYIPIQPLLLFLLTLNFLYAQSYVESEGDLTISQSYPSVAKMGGETTIRIKGEGFTENTKVSVLPFSKHLSAEFIQGEIDTGYAYSTALSSDGTLAYVADHDGLKIIDVSKPDKPISIGSYSSEKIAKSVFLSPDDYLAYLIDVDMSYGVPDVIDIIDVSNPNKPVQKGNISIDGDATSIAFSSNGSLAFVTYGDNAVTNFIGLKIFDVTDPMNPTEIGSLNTGDAQSIALSAKNSIAYIAGGYEFMAIDISNPSDPSLMGSLSTGYIYSMAISHDESVAYVAYAEPFVAGVSGVYVIDISNSNQIKHINEIAIESPVNSIAISTDGSLAIIASSIGLEIIDISKPEKYIHKAIIEIGSNANSIILSPDGMLAYVASGNEGLKILEMAITTTPTFKSSIDTSGSTLSISLSKNGLFAFVAEYYAGLNIIDISNSDALSPIGHVDIEAQHAAFSPDGTKAYIAGFNSFSTINLESHQKPVMENVIYTGGDAQFIALSSNGSLAYVAHGGFYSRYNGLKIIDISNSTAPMIIGEYETDSWIYYVALSSNDDFAFIVDDGIYDYETGLYEERGFKIIDMTNPEEPILYKSVKTSERPTSITLSSDMRLAYLLGDGGLQIFDISDLSDLVLISSLGNIKSSYSCTLSLDENMAFIATLDGMSIVSVSDPLEPILVGSIETNGNARRITLSPDEDLLYVADGEAGLKVIEYLNPTNVTLIDSETLEFTFPPYTVPGKYNIRVYNDNENWSKAYAAITLEAPEVLESTEKQNHTILKHIGKSSPCSNPDNNPLFEKKECFVVGDTIEVSAIMRNRDNTYPGVDVVTYDDLFTILEDGDYELVSSDTSIATVLGNRVIFKSSGIVTISFQTRTQEGSATFYVEDEEGDIAENSDPLDMLLVLGDDVGKRELESALLSNGNALYLAGVNTAGSSTYVRYLNAISKKESKLLDINGDSILDSVVIDKEVNANTIQSVLNDIEYSSKPLIFYFVGHGLPNHVILENSIPQGSNENIACGVNTQCLYGYTEDSTDLDLKTLLDDFQERTNRAVLVIIDACHSGSLVEALNSDTYDRTVITSSNAIDTASIAKADGTTFSRYLRGYFLKGEDILDSFDKASQAYREISPGKEPSLRGETNSPSSFKANKRSISDTLESPFVSFALYRGGEKLEMVNSLLTIGERETDTLTIELTLNLSEIERRALIDDAIKCFITPPQEVVAKEGSISTIDVGTLSLEYSEEKSSESISVYEGAYTFNQAGFYSLFYGVVNNIGNSLDSEEVVKIRREPVSGDSELAVEYVDDDLNELSIGAYGGEANKKSMVVTLSKGWNLISSPIDQNIIPISHLKGRYEVIYGYDNESTEWMENPIKLEPQKGYWVKMKEEYSLEFIGSRYDTKDIELQKGWNLIGVGERIYKYEIEQLEESANSYYFQWDGNSGNWKSGGAIRYLKEADGVWVYQR